MGKRGGFLNFPKSIFKFKLTHYLLSVIIAFMKKTLLSLVLLVTVSACATERLQIKHSYEITDAKISQLDKGSTTKESLVKLFGKPLDSIQEKNGVEHWYYKDFNLRALYLTLTPQGILDDYDASAKTTTKYTFFQN